MYEVGNSPFETPADVFFGDVMSAVSYTLRNTFDGLIFCFQIEENQMHLISCRLCAPHKLYI